MRGIYTVIEGRAALGMTAAVAQVVRRRRRVAVVIGAVGGQGNISFLCFVDTTRSVRLRVVAEAGQRDNVNLRSGISVVNNFDELRVSGNGLGWTWVADTALCRARGSARFSANFDPVARRRKMGECQSREQDGGDAHCASARAGVSRYARTHAHTETS